MAKIALHQLGDVLRRERGQKGIREVAQEIGVSPATLSRIERGSQPDLGTFGKICRWLDIDPAEVLDVEIPRSFNSESEEMPLTSTAHFKADQTTTPELAQALAEMILAAQKMISRGSS